MQNRVFITEQAINSRQMEDRECGIVNLGMLDRGKGRAGLNGWVLYGKGRTILQEIPANR